MHIDRFNLQARTCTCNYLLQISERKSVVHLIYPNYQCFGCISSRWYIISGMKWLKKTDAVWKSFQCMCMAWCINIMWRMFEMYFLCKQWDYNDANCFCTHSAALARSYVALPLTTTRCQCELTRVCSIHISAGPDAAEWEMQQLWSDPSQNLVYGMQSKQSSDIESKQNTVKVDSLWSSHE